MKKIKKYMFIAITFVFAALLMKSNVILADEQTPPASFERVVINPNSEGVGTYIYDSVQYAKSREVGLKINVKEEEKSIIKYFKVCEKYTRSSGSNKTIEDCSFYEVTEENESIQLKGPEDGEKKLTISFYTNYNDYQNGNDLTEFKTEKTIVLDTTAPVIVLLDKDENDVKSGAGLTYIESGKKYVEYGARCTNDDQTIQTDCTVTIEEANINYSTGDMQYIRYTAKDFLGNEAITTRRVIVEQTQEKKVGIYWYFAGGFIVILGLYLGYVVIKNNEKKKNLSVLG